MIAHENILQVDDLINQLSKYKGKGLIFRTVDNLDGGEINIPLYLYSVDKQVLFEVRDSDGKSTDNILMCLIDSRNPGLRNLRKEPETMEIVRFVSADRKYDFELVIRSKTVEAHSLMSDNAAKLDEILRTFAVNGDYNLMGELTEMVAVHKEKTK